MAPAIVGTVAVDRAIELAKRVHDKLGESITEFKLTEDYEVVPLECPEPGLHCKITPRGILVVGGVLLGAYGLWTLSKWLKSRVLLTPEERAAAAQWQQQGGGGFNAEWAMMVAKWIKGA